MHLADEGAKRQNDVCLVSARDCKRRRAIGTLLVAGKNETMCSKNDTSQGMVDKDLKASCKQKQNTHTHTPATTNNCCIPRYLGWERSS